MSRYTYGGQALIEGVLMRGRDAIAVALRHPDGRIVYATERLDSGFHGTRWSKLPLLRGLVVLYETLIVGTRWLVRSANVQAEEDGVELGKGSIALMLGITLVLGIGIFFLLPLLIATFTAGSVENDLVQHLVEGLVRVHAHLVLNVLAPLRVDVVAVAGGVKLNVFGAFVGECFAFGLDDGHAVPEKLGEVLVVGVCEALLEQDGRELICARQGHLDVARAVFLHEVHLVLGETLLR
jgi:hypothetical protein